MQIGGFVKTSFVDYPGRIASVVFTQGCNLNCSYCHNAGLIKRMAGAACNGTEHAGATHAGTAAHADDTHAGTGLMDVKLINSEDILSWLSKRSGLIDAVVISGGEPTIQSDLETFIGGLKDRGLFVKLDTNGTNPNVLAVLIKEELVDFIAMDIKAPLGKYTSVCGMQRMDLQSVQRSVKLIKGSGLDYEFRTTFCSELEDDDILQLITEFQISSNYVVQNCRSTDSVESIRCVRNIVALAQRLGQSSGCPSCPSCPSCSFRGFGTQAVNTKKADAV